VTESNVDQFGTLLTTGCVLLQSYVPAMGTTPLSSTAREFTYQIVDPLTLNAVIVNNDVPQYNYHQGPRFCVTMNGRHCQRGIGADEMVMEPSETQDDHFICNDKASSCSSDVFFSGEEFSPTLPDRSSDAEDVASPTKDIPSPPSPSPTCKILPDAILLAGDSFMKGIDPKKLQRGKIVNILNLAQSGQTIKQVKRSLVQFSENSGADYQVMKVFLCAGTNDIKYFSDKGVHYLKPHINDLIKTAKYLFPSAVIYFQSLIPLPVNNRPFIVEDIDQLNKIIYEACCRQRCFMIDAMSEMMNKYSIRNPALFKRNNIHPNANGYSVLAKLYLRAIHSA